MGIKNFIGTLAPEPKVLKLIGEKARRQGKNELTLREINAEIRSVRKLLKEGAIRRAKRDRAIANDEFEDYLELHDPKVKAHIRKSYEDYRAGRGRPIEEFLAEMKTKRRMKKAGGRRKA